LPAAVRLIALTADKPDPCIAIPSNVIFATDDIVLLRASIRDDEA